MPRLCPPFFAPHGLGGAVAFLLFCAACASSEPTDSGNDLFPEAGAAGAREPSSDGGVGGAGAPAAGAGSGGKSIIAGGSGGMIGAAGTTFVEDPCPIERIEVEPSDLPGACTQSFPQDLFGGREFEAELVNVSLELADTEAVLELYRVGAEQECEGENGWYYSDDSYAISLCPVSCELLTDQAGGAIVVQVGCPGMVRPE